MKILVYGINYSPELTGIGKYTGEMVAWMAQQGHDVRVITAPPYYPQWKVNGRYSSWRYRREDGEASTAFRQFRPEQFLPAAGAAPLEAGSHHWGSTDAVLYAGNAPAGEAVRGAHSAAYSGLGSCCHVGTWHGGQRQARHGGKTGQRL